MDLIKLPFPWFVLVDPEDDSLLVVFSFEGDDSKDMLAIFTSEEYADLYNERGDYQFVVHEIPDLDEAIELLDHVSAFDPSGETDQVRFICMDPIDPNGDEGLTAFRIAGMLAELRRLNR